MVNSDSPKDAPRDPPKPIPPVMPRRGKSDDDDDAPPAAPVKQKTLPTGLSRAIVIAAVIASLAVSASALFSNRYDLVPAPNSANGFMYRIDRLLGAVQFCGPQGCSELPRSEK